jgi:myosin heavy subunit
MGSKRPSPQKPTNRKAANCRPSLYSLPAPVKAELSYVQRTIEKQVLTVRELEEDKAALESQLREVTAGKAQLSTTATRLQQKTGDLTQTLDRERLAATEWQANLKEATDRAVQLLKTSQEKASAAQSHLNELLTVSDTLKVWFTRQHHLSASLCTAWILFDSPSSALPSHTVRVCQQQGAHCAAASRGGRVEGEISICCCPAQDTRYAARVGTRKGRTP